MQKFLNHYLSYKSSINHTAENHMINSDVNLQNIDICVRQNKRNPI